MGYTKTPSTRVSVDRMALIRAIESKAAQCKKEYEKVKATSSLEARVIAWRDGEVKRLREGSKTMAADATRLAKISPKKLIEDGGFKSTGIRYPDHMPFDRNNDKSDGFATILRMLRMSTKKDISLTEDQFRSYMDGCPV